MTGLRIAGLAIALPLVLGCASHTPSATTPRRAAGADVPKPEYYDAPGPVPAPIERELRWRKEHNELWRIMLPPRVVPAVAHVRRVKDPIELYFLRALPIGRKPRPLVFMFPILSNSTFLMFELGSGFNRMGYDVALVLRKEIEFDAVRSVDEGEEELRVMVMRGRQAIDWLVEQPAVDAARIGLFGISAGGVLGASLVAADPRIRAQVFVFAGAPMADVMVDTTEDLFTDKIARVQAERGWSREQVRETLRRTLRSDPLALAPRISRERTLMFIASDDESVPTRNQELLWEALGRPKAWRIDAGHYVGVALYLPVILSQSQRFLGQHLGAP